MERKSGLFKIPVFSGDGGLSSKIHLIYLRVARRFYGYIIRGRTKEMKEWGGDLAKKFEEGNC